MILQSKRKDIKRFDYEWFKVDIEQPNLKNPYVVIFLFHKSKSTHLKTCYHLHFYAAIFT